MSKKLIWSVSVLLLVLGVGVLSAEDWGCTNIVDGETRSVEEGQSVTVNCPARWVIESDGRLNMNGGELTVTVGEKFMLSDDFGCSYIYLNAGTLTINGAFDAECERCPEIHIGGGVMRFSQDYHTTWECTDDLFKLLPDYGPLQYTQEGGYWVLRAEGGTAAVQFDSAASGDLESVSPAILTVVVDDAQNEVVTVDYAVAGGTATAGADYVLSPGTLTFNPGETTKTISIQITDDGVDEDDETIVVALSNAAGGDTELGTVTQHTYTIKDPRPGVEFDSAGGSGPENAQIIHRPRKIGVSLSVVMDSPVTVDFARVGGTALMGGDYILDAGTLTFAPGEVAKSIDLTIIDDKTAESDETVVIQLSNPSAGLKLGANAQYTYTIGDNDTGAEPPNKDLNGDGAVDYKDFIILVEAWLECTLNPPELCWQ